MNPSYLAGVRQALRALNRLSLREDPRQRLIRDWLSGLKMDLLHEVDIFQDLSPAEMAWLKDTTRMVTFRAGEVIYDEGTDGEALFILKVGRVRLFRVMPEGRRLEIATLDRGTFFGEMPLLSQRMHGSMAEAIEDSLICIMDRTDIERVIMAKPQVGIRMVAALSARLAASQLREDALAFLDVQQRLAARLLDLAQGSTVPSTHQELAEMVGAHRETVTKALDTMRRAGLIDLAYGKITLKRRPELAGLAGGEARTGFL